MIRRSSIFNFDTLRFRPRVPRGVCFALIVLAVMELAARALVHYRLVSPDPSLRTTIESRVDRIDTVHPPVWWIGNSTLDYGVDISAMQVSLGVPMIKLPHGSATLAATAAMLQYYIDLTGEKPRQVIITLTKDDLNRNGSRADFSRRYLEIAHGDVLPSAEWLMLRRARSNLRAGAIEMLRSLHKHPAPPRRTVVPYDGTPLTSEFTANVALIKNYEFDTDAWQALHDVCQRNGLPPPIIVLMPVTDQYLLFHDRLIEKPKTSRIRRDVQDMAQAGHMPFIDYMAEPDREYWHFRDPYHLSPAGEAVYTERLTRDLRPLLQHVTTPG